MSSLTPVRSDMINYVIYPPVVDGKSIVGTAKMLLYKDGELLLERAITVLKRVVTETTKFEMTDIVHGYVVSGSCKFTSTEPLKHTYRYDDRQIDEAIEEARRVLRKR